MYQSWLVSSPCVLIVHAKRLHTEKSELPYQRNGLEKMGQNGEDAENCGDMIYKEIETLSENRCGCYSAGPCVSRVVTGVGVG